MNKQKRLNKIIEAIKYIANVDDDIALGYAGIFEEICDEYIKTGLICGYCARIDIKHIEDLKS